MDRTTEGWWGRLVDRWVRVKSNQLDDRVLIRRKLLHTAQVLAVFPILELDRRWLALILAAACAFVIVTQRRVPYTSLALLTLLAFALRLAVAGAWVVFTIGDGLAAIAGRSVAGPKLSWNRRKTWAGSLSFLAAAGFALFLLLRWRATNLEGTAMLFVAAGVAAAAGLVESLDLPLDDNYSVVVVAGAMLDLALLVSGSS